MRSSSSEGFPEKEDTGAQVFALGNSIRLGPKINWTQQIGFSRQKVYSNFSHRPCRPRSVGISVPGNNMPGVDLVDFAQNNSDSLSGKIGPYNADNFVDQGYFENRLSPLEQCSLLAR